MDSLNLILTFREVVQRGGFSAAARALDMSQANVSKQVAALEERFGVRLFHRTTRRVSLTDAGQFLYERSGPVLEIVNLTRDELLARAESPRGRLVTTAPHALMQTPLPQLLGSFLARYPQVSLRLELSNHMIDLAGAGVDVALRVGQVPDARLIVRRLQPVELAVAATPAYWQAHGLPKHPRDLLDHRTLVMAQPDEGPRWIFMERGRPLELALRQPVLESNDVAPLLPLALQGLGVVCLPRLMLAPYLDSGALQDVLQSYMPSDMWLYAAYAQRRHNSAALRELLACLEEEIGRWQPEQLEWMNALQPPAPAPKPTRRTPAKATKAARGQRAS